MPENAPWRGVRHTTGRWRAALDEDGTTHFRGGHDDSSGEAVRQPDSGIILRASGVEGSRPWRLEGIATDLTQEPQGLLEPVDVAPPTP